jgi:hypothetical protein
MKLADQWRAAQLRLPDDWQDVRLTVVPEQAADLPRVAAVLGSANAGLSGDRLVIHALRAGASSPAALERLFARLDDDRVWCTLDAGDVVAAAPPDEVVDAPAVSVAESWDVALAELPPDWTELLCQIEVGGSALLPRAALLCAPINPTRDRSTIGFVFRVGRVGYGASAGMARRCFERLDEEGIRGSVSVLRVLSDTEPVASQGSSWIVGGRVL